MVVAAHDLSKILPSSSRRAAWMVQAFDMSLGSTTAEGPTSKDTLLGSRRILRIGKRSSKNAREAANHDGWPMDWAIAAAIVGKVVVARSAVPPLKGFWAET